MAGKSFPELTSRGTAALIVAEGKIPYVYDDAVYPTKPWKVGTPVKGFLTAGVGHLLDAAEVKLFGGKDISMAQITRWLDADTDEAERDVHRLVKVKLTDYERDALVMFRFNVGATAFANSTLLRKLNAGDKASVPKELAKWTKTTINGKKVTSKGLVKRRADETAYWLSGAVPAERENNMPSGTQIAEASKQPITPTEIIGVGTTAVGAATGFANATGFVAVAFGIALIIVVGVAAAIAVKRYVLDNRSGPAPVQVLE